MTTMGRPEPEVGRVALQAWEAAVCAPDLVWHASGRGRWSGARHGLNEVFDYLGALGEAADEFSSRIEDVLVSERRAAVLFHVSGRRGERRLETDFVLLFEIEDGLIRGIRSISGDQLAVDEFWA